MLFRSELKAKNILSGNVASLKNTETDRDTYASALMILENSGCRYFGQLDDKKNINQQLDELSKMKINYLITWKNTSWGNDIPVYYDEEAGVGVYMIKYKAP